MNVCVYGASSASLADVYYTEAEKLGRLLAQRGHRLVFGGGKHGLMGSVAQGVWQERGEILGIAPKFFDEPDVLFEHCTDFIYTTTMRERKQLMEDRSDAVIVLPGGIGTYEEFFEILTLKQLGQTSRAIAILNTNHYYDPMLAFLQNTVDQKFMSSNCMDLFFIHDDPKQLLDYIDRYVPVSGNLDRLGDYTK